MFTSVLFSSSSPAPYQSVAAFPTAHTQLPAGIQSALSSGVENVPQPRGILLTYICTESSSSSSTLSLSTSSSSSSCTSSILSFSSSFSTSPTLSFSTSSSPSHPTYASPSYSTSSLYWYLGIDLLCPLAAAISCPLMSFSFQAQHGKLALAQIDSCSNFCLRNT